MSLVASFILEHSVYVDIYAHIYVYMLPSVLWHGYLSGAKCKWFAYGPADATATPTSLAPVKSRMVYLSWPAYPDCPGKKAVKRMY